MNDGLKDKHRQAIIDILAANSRVKRVALFGSRAMGTFTTTSDVDLALYGDELTLTDQAKLAATIDDLPMAQKVDLLLYKSIDNDNLKEHIRKYGVEWFQRGWRRSAESWLLPGWTNSTIDDLKANIKTAIAIGPFGSRMKSDCYVETGIPVIRGTNLTGGRVFVGKFVFITEEKANELGGANVYKNDLVFPHRGATGEVGIITEDKRYILSSSLMKLTCNKEIADPLLMYYFFKSKTGRHELLKNASQVGTPGIGQPLTSLKGIRLNLPPINEQKKIAKILGSLDDKIELNRQTNQTLEQIAQAIFKSWFVDFEPVKAKIAAKESGQDPERAAMCAISGKSNAELNQLPADQLSQLATTAALFPDELVESEQGMIPEGWKWKSLKEAVELNPKRILKKGVIAPYLDMRNMPTQGHLAETWYPREMGSGTKFINGDTLMARITPCLENGKTAFVDFLNEGEVGWGSTEYIVIRSKVPLPVEYAYLLARDNIFRSFAIQNMTGTSGRQRVNVSSLENYQVAVADKENIYGIFSITVKKLMTQIKCNGEQNKTLTQLRDTLLPKLLSGEISVADTQAKIEAAV